MIVRPPKPRPKLLTVASAIWDVAWLNERASDAGQAIDANLTAELRQALKQSAVSHQQKHPETNEGDAMDEDK